MIVRYYYKQYLKHESKVLVHVGSFALIVTLRYKTRGTLNNTVFFVFQQGVLFAIFHCFLDDQVTNHSPFTTAKFRPIEN